MLESIEVSAIIPASPKRIYEAWLSSEEHAAFTGDPASIDPQVGGKFTAGGDYIEGATLELEPYRRIVQTWRSTDFPAGSSDSHLEVLLEEVEGGTRVRLIHTDIPEGQGSEYQQGWIDYYLEPMKRYFSP